MPTNAENIIELTNQLSARAHAVRTANRGTNTFQTAVDRLFGALVPAYAYLVCPAGAENVWSAFTFTRTAAKNTYETNTGKTLGIVNPQAEYAAFLTRFREQVATMRRLPSSTAAYALTLSIENASSFNPQPADLAAVIAEARQLLQEGETNQAAMPSGAPRVTDDRPGMLDYFSDKKIQLMAGITAAVVIYLYYQDKGKK